MNRLGHGSAGEVLASLTASPVAPHLSMMDFVDLARRAATTASRTSLGELEKMVRAALTEIVDGRRRAGAVTDPRVA